MPTPNEIRSVREGCGITQQQMADCLGVCRRTVQEWEGGRRTMSAGLWEFFIVVLVADGLMDAADAPRVRQSLQRLLRHSTPN